MSNRPLKIAFVIDDLGYGGAQRQLSVLVEGLSKSAEPHVYCLSEITTPFAEAIRSAGVRVVSMRRAHGFDLARLRSLAREISREGTDVVHGFLDAANVYAYLAARLAGLPCVLSLRSETTRLVGLRGWCLRYALRHTDRAVANSKVGARFLSDVVAVAPERTAVVRNAVAPSFLSEGAGGPHTSVLPSPPVIGFVGRLAPSKRLGLLVDAHAMLADRVPDARLVLIGDGPERESLYERAGRLGTLERVTMTGAVVDVERHLRQFSCLVLPSEFEGFPNVVLEALALGVPVVARPVGDIEEAVADGHTGFLLREDSAAALADLLSRVIADEALRKRTAVEGPAIVRDHYSLSAATNVLSAMYAELVGNQIDRRS